METVKLENKSRKLHANGTYDECHEFIQPYYLENIGKSNYLEIQKYISNLSDSDYKFNKNTEFGHYNGYDDKCYRWEPKVVRIAFLANRYSTSLYG